MRFRFRYVAVSGLLVLGATGLRHSWKPLPDGLDFHGETWPLADGDVAFLQDRTLHPADGGDARLHQEIFDAACAMIDAAETLVVADFFLVNEFAGGAAPTPEADGTLSARFVRALVSVRRRNPDAHVILITDPFNTLYGGVPQPLFEQLEAAGVEVVLTDLRRLRDGNLLYSPLWRTLLRWLAQPVRLRLANPVGAGTLGLSPWLELLNFKANHRKVLVTDHADGRLRGLVTSANPHSASARHGNVALRFRGAAVTDLLRTEEAVYRYSTGRDFPAPVRTRIRPQFAGGPPDPAAVPQMSLRVLTEQAILRALLEGFERCGPGDRVDIGLFYFSEVRLRRAVVAAVNRGAEVRVLLDPNRDAFGRPKHGIPNLPVGAHLHDRGVAVRWAYTTGEQFHAKMALFQRQTGTSKLVLGSANWTRRNLRNLNLETNVALAGPADAAVFRDAATYFEGLWGTAPDAGSDPDPPPMMGSVPFSAHQDRSWRRRWLYRFMEQSGASTF